MRILHTADWHLGKKSDDLDRGEELKYVLNQIKNIAQEKEVDMVIIAGDVYESLVPSAEAENLFYRTVSDLSNNGNTAVVVISGNHDDPKRLSNASVFASKFNVYLVGDINNIAISNELVDKNIFPIESGQGYIKFRTRAGEEAVVACLPYPSFYRYNEIKHEGDNINDKIKEWLKPAVAQFSNNTINILTAHVLTYGKDLTITESLDYQTVSSMVNYVDDDILKVPADYIALGHIHTMVHLDKAKDMYYSGSIINTSFSPSNDNDKFVLVADIHAGNCVNVEPIQLDCKKMDVFESDDIDEIENFCNVAKDDYIKVIYRGSDKISFEELKELRKRHPNLITFSVINNEFFADRPIESKRNLSNSELFENFVKDTTGKKAKPEVKELFLQLMGENLYEAD